MSNVLSLIGNMDRNESPYLVDLGVKGSSFHVNLKLALAVSEISLNFI